MTIKHRRVTAQSDEYARAKPPMPENLGLIAERAKQRHLKRHANPGVAIEVEESALSGYRITSPHSDDGAWRAMICDALGTRSESTAKVFVQQLAQLCSQAWHPDVVDGQGRWLPDETELNMILNLVTSIKPRNEMQAALAAQMVAVHLMTMKATEEALRHGRIDPLTASVAGKLARTFVMQMDALERAKGRKTTRQEIRVSYEKHDHKHVHVDRGAEHSGTQPLAKASDAPVAAMLGQDPGGWAVPISGNGKRPLLHARGQRFGSTKG